MAAGGLLCMRVRLYILLILICLLFFAVYFSRKAAMVPAMDSHCGKPSIVIDPGHGGEDGGAVGTDGVRESTINLAVSLRMDSLLGLFGWPCVLTRMEESIEYPPKAVTVKKRKQADLERRVQLVNNLSTPILISIHQNKYPDGGPRGAQVLYRDDAESICFAGFVQGRLKEALGSNNVRPSVPIPDSIYLMRKVGCPAILVECGFLSNPEESKLLRSEAYQTRLALCMACACAEYAREWENAYGQGSES